MFVNHAVRAKYNQLSLVDASFADPVYINISKHCFVNVKYFVQAAGRVSSDYVM